MLMHDAFVSLQQHLALNGAQDNIAGLAVSRGAHQARNRQTSYHRRFAESLDAEMQFLSDDASPEQHVLEKENYTGSRWPCERWKSPSGNAVAAGRGFALPGDWRSAWDGYVNVGDTVERAIRKLAKECSSLVERCNV